MAPLLPTPTMSATVSTGATIPLSTPRNLAPYFLTAPLVLYMLAFYALPVIAMLLRSVSDPHWSLDNYRQLSHDSVFLAVFTATLRVSFVVTAGSLLLGYPVALALSRLRGSLAAIVLVLVLLPFWTSVLVRSYAWMVLLGRHGLVNEALLATSLIATPLRLLNTPIAVVAAPASQFIETNLF